MTNENEETNHGLIKTPSQTLTAAALGFLIPVFVILGLVYYYTSGTQPAAGGNNSAESMDQRIGKVGHIVVAGSPEAAAQEKVNAAQAAAPAPVASVASANTGDSGEAAGKKIYEATCKACHGTGAAGAPKFGDKAAWAPRLAAGFDEVLKIATQGKGAMPPKGGSTASDADFKAAVEYLTNAAK
jgi:cytochrome c5